MAPATFPMPKMKKLTSRFSSKQRATDDPQAAGVDSPELNASRGVRLFCESGAPGNSGDEVLHLPVIVEAAESSPQAAAAAASEIRTILQKDYYSKPHLQYNAIMLIRILASNPGKPFTKNMDSKFTATVKDLLRQCRDPSVQQIMRETLDALESEKAYDDNLIPLMQMWRKEKGLPERGAYAQYQTTQARNFQALSNPGMYARQPPANFAQPAPRSQVVTLPPPDELAGRVEEGRTTAKILIQLIQSTPPTAVPTNDLIKEFAQRGDAAQRSLQSYMNCVPPPDPDTFQTLIETCEQLSLASSKHQRAILQARRAISSPSATPPPPSLNPASTWTAAPSSQPPSAPPQVRTNPVQLQPPSSAQPSSIPLPPANIQAQLQNRETSAQLLPSSNPYSEVHQSSGYQIPPVQQHEPISPTFAKPRDTFERSDQPSPATPPAHASTFNYQSSASESFRPPSGPPPGHALAHVEEQSPNSFRRKPIPPSSEPSVSNPYASGLYDEDSTLYAVSPVASRKGEVESSDYSDAPAAAARNPFADDAYSSTSTQPQSGIPVSPVTPKRSIPGRNSGGSFSSSSPKTNPYNAQGQRNSITAAGAYEDPIGDFKDPSGPISPSLDRHPAFSDKRNSNPYYAAAAAASTASEQSSQPTTLPMAPQQAPPQPAPYSLPFASRESYYRRQDDAAGGLTMSGAGSPAQTASPPPPPQGKMGWRHRTFDA